MLRSLSILSSLLLFAASASATPVVYDFVSGSASIGVHLGGSQVASVSTALDGSYVVYDAMAGSIDDFELSTSSQVALPFGTLDLGITALPGAGYASVPGSSSSIDLGPVAIVLDAVLATFFPIPFSLDLTAQGPVGVDVAIAGDTGTFDVSEILFGFTKFRTDFKVSLDVQFVGKATSPAIPEPTSALLFLVGGGAAAWAIRRHARFPGALA